MNETLGNEQIKQFEQISKWEERVTHLSIDYWLNYSHIYTWQFWFLIGLLVVPLVALFILLDRRKAFHLGFFGLNVHVWFHYIDLYGEINRLWGYPYKVIPFLRSSFALDSAVIPVSYLLLYQWAINRGKNYYFYLTGLCFFFAFLFKPALVEFGVFRLYKGVNYFHLFLCYLVVMLLSVAFTKLFQFLQDTSTEHVKLKSLPKRRYFLTKIFRFKEKAR